MGKITHLTLLLLTLAAALLSAENTVNLFTENKKHEQLQWLDKKLEEAMSQTEMNIASSELAEFWNDELERLELDIRLALTDDRAELFQVAAETWRTHRYTQMLYEGSEARGGSIRPLIHNTVCIEITKDRIRYLIQSENIQDYPLATALKSEP